MSADMLSSISNMVVAISAVVAAVCAAMGLRTWRHELRGRVDFDLARRIRRASLMVQDAFERARNPLFGNSNQALTELDDALATLDAEALEAAAVWKKKKEIRSLARPLDELRHELLGKHRVLRESPPEVTIEEHDAARPVVFKLSDDSDGDEFGRRVNEAVQQIEVLVSSQL